MNTSISEHAAIRLPLNRIAMWQGLTFFMLICAVWACESFGLLHEGVPVIKRVVLLTTVLALGGVIVVAHSYLQEQRALHGLITICSYCRKVRIDEHAWTQVEQFVTEHSRANFSHGVCPACFQRLTAELAGKTITEKVT